MNFFSKLLVCVSLFSCIALFANEGNVKIKDFDAAAQKGDPRAQYNMGVFFFAGDGVKQDYETAVKWFRKAADQGVTEAEYNLGWCYANGKGVTADKDEAKKWYSKAAEKGHTRAAEFIKSTEVVETYTPSY